MTFAWVLPISEEHDSARLHLVPDEGGPLVYAACKKMINLQFAQRPITVKHCHYCTAALARRDGAAA